MIPVMFLEKTLSAKKIRANMQKNKGKDNAFDFITDESHIGGGDTAEQTEKAKRDFLKNKKKISSLLPKEQKMKSNLPDRLGYFKTKFGLVTVGYDKFKKNTPFGFNILPKEREIGIKQSEKKDFNDRHNYFGKNFSGNKKKISFGPAGTEYDPKRGQFRKIEESGEADSENELLYEEDSKENEQIENLRKQTQSGLIKVTESEEAITDLDAIHDEKMRDNMEFKRKIEEFLKKFKGNKLKEYEDSDFLKKLKERITKEDNGFIILKKRIEELIAENQNKKAKKLINLQANKKYMSRLLNLFNHLGLKSDG
jgi:hypothetical protein